MKVGVTLPIFKGTRLRVGAPIRAKTPEMFKGIERGNIRGATIAYKGPDLGPTKPLYSVSGGSSTTMSGTGSAEVVADPGQALGAASGGGFPGWLWLVAAAVACYFICK
jgi:hypothetical protein